MWLLKDMTITPKQLKEIIQKNFDGYAAFMVGETVYLASNWTKHEKEGTVEFEDVSEIDPGVVGWDSESREFKLKVDFLTPSKIKIMILNDPLAGSSEEATTEYYDDELQSTVDWDGNVIEYIHHHVGPEEGSEGDEEDGK